MIKRTTRFLVCIILGVFFTIELGAGIGRLISLGYLNQWDKLPTPPAQIEKLVIGSHGTVYAQTETGSVYRCSSWTNECWVQDEIPQNTSHLMETITPCDFSTPEFSWTTNPPGDPVLCIHGEEIHIDCFWQATYLLDENGDVWQWSKTTCANYMTLIVLGGLIAIGIILGLVTGAVWNRQSDKRSNS